MSRKVWVLVEKEGEEFKILAGTEDKFAAQKILSALLSYKDNMVKSGKPDLTIINSKIIDDIVPEKINDLLNHEELATDRIFDMVEDK